MKIGLSFGALVPSLKEQLVSFKFSDDVLTFWQRDADEITRLVIRGILTDSAATIARKKLLRNILKHLALEARKLQGAVK